MAGLEHVVVAVILMGRDDRMKERRGGEGGAKGPKRAEEGEKEGIHRKVGEEGRGGREARDGEE